VVVVEIGLDAAPAAELPFGGTGKVAVLPLDAVVYAVAVAVAASYVAVAKSVAAVIAAAE